MKTILLSTFALSFIIPFQSNTTTFSEPTNDSKEIFYILDDIKTPHLNKPYKSDDSPNYIQVNNGEAIIVGRFSGVRGLINYYMFGNVNNFKEYISEEGNKTVSFYIKGKRRNLGKIKSIDIIHKSNNEINIHFYNKLGSWESWFTAHKAAKNEILEIKKYWEERRAYTNRIIK